MAFILARSVPVSAQSICRACPSRRAMACRAQSQTSVIGGGRIGTALQKLDSSITLVKRGESIPSEAGPIIIATRNDALAGIADSTPKDRREDLVFIQNGMLQPWLDKQGLGDNTQVLVFFAVAKMGETPSGGRTELNPEGLTAATGKHAQAVADLFAKGDLSCKVLGREDYAKSMLEKLIWICAFMAVGAVHKKTVGEVVSDHRVQVAALIDELAKGGSKELGVQLQEGTVQRLASYAESVAHFPTAVKEFEWRNGWFWSISQRETEAGRSDPFPIHSSLLKVLGVV